MATLTWKSAILTAAGAAGVYLAVCHFFPSATVNFSVDVKPILNKHCLSCHGGVRRKAGLSLLTREDALSPTESGKPAIVPGKPESSEFIRRLNHPDPEERMPYQEAPLSKTEISILTKWVQEGAHWDVHWSYRPVAEIKPPKPSSLLGFLPWSGSGNGSFQVKNEVDFFILDKLKKEGLTPSPEASKAALLRRVSLDLIGIPAPHHLAQQFLGDNSPTAYERLVDSLLASPRFGERWTALWLDLARFADTKGYERDDRRQIWRYRDWLIRAFNDDLPYDRFLTEQLAGDLLPHPTDNQLIATAFHRNTMTNDEGGTDNEEFRTAAVIDRVNTTWEALMGTTFACVQCHDHPYDPFRQEEYYRFFAFFNNTRDADTEEDYPLLRHFSPADSARLQQLKGWMASKINDQKAEEVALFIKTLGPSKYSLETDSLVNAALYDTKWLGLRHQGFARMPGVNLDGKSRLIFRYEGLFGNGQWTVRLDSLDGLPLFTARLKKTNGWVTEKIDFQPVSGTHDLYFTYSNRAIKNPDLAGMQFNWFHFTEPLPGEKSAGGPDMVMQKTYWELLDVSCQTTPVMLENPPAMQRLTHVFERGNWLVKGKQVSPGVPNHLPDLPKNAPPNRLGLAQWMTDPQHPLVARTMVNRLWEQLFGTGLAETLEDLGSQGIPPTHPELLDWLSWQFVHEYDWSVKRLLKTMVLSATYCQEAKVSPAKLAKDPFNKWYARGPRVRLSAEQLRDQALAVAGLLSAKMYGPSVMPYQPEGIWQSPWNGDDWKISDGEDRYRRSLYTFLKRTGPYPSMLTFDGVAREVCAARRVRTNTPLQALVTLNDEAFLDAARRLANRMKAMEQPSPTEKIAAAYRWVTGNEITRKKSDALLKLYAESLKKYRTDKAAAAALAGEPSENVADLAALTLVANALMNLDEFIVK
jgi:hypothetical protein